LNLKTNKSNLTDERSYPCKLCLQEEATTC